MIVNNKGEAVFIGAPLSSGLNRLSPAQAEAFNKEIQLRGNKELLDAKVIEVVPEEKPNKKAGSQKVSAKDVEEVLTDKEEV